MDVQQIREPGHLGLLLDLVAAVDDVRGRIEDLGLRSGRRCGSHPRCTRSEEPARRHHRCSRGVHRRTSARSAATRRSDEASVEFDALPTEHHRRPTVLVVVLREQLIELRVFRVGYDGPSVLAVEPGCVVQVVVGRTDVFELDETREALPRPRLIAQPQSRCVGL